LFTPLLFYILKLQNELVDAHKQYFCPGYILKYKLTFFDRVGQVTAAATPVVNRL